MKTSALRIHQQWVPKEASFSHKPHFLQLSYIVQPTGTEKSRKGGSMSILPKASMFRFWLAEEKRHSPGYRQLDLHTSKQMSQLKNLHYTLSLLITNLRTKEKLLHSQHYCFIRVMGTFSEQMKERTNRAVILNWEGRGDRILPGNMWQNLVTFFGCRNGRAIYTVNAKDTTKHPTV